MKKRAALISGGGSWGAYGGGTLARINGNYDTVIGVSTGALMATATALQEWEHLKVAYSTNNTYDIFDKYWYKPFPFTKKGSINKMAIIMTLLLGEKSIATTNTLKRSLERFLTESRFYDLQWKNKEVIVGVQNYAQVPSRIHYFSNLDETHEDFVNWVWCSANFPLFSSLVKNNWKDSEGNFHVGLWGDGGLSDLVGIDQLHGKNYSEIDIILHRTKIHEKFEGNEIDNLMDNVTSNINAMRYGIEFEYFKQKVQGLAARGAKVTIYWLPRKLSTNWMIFNPKEMVKWWEEGYETAFDPDRMEVFDPIIV